MKRKLLYLFVAVNLIVSLFGVALPAAATTITPDGQPSDWTGIPPVVEEPGDIPSGPDIGAAFLTHDTNNLYVRMDIGAMAPGTALHIGIDADRDIGTGYNTDTDSSNIFLQPHNIGIDYEIRIVPGPSPTAKLYSLAAGLWSPTEIAPLPFGLAPQGQPFLAEVAVSLNLITYPFPWKFVFWVNPVGQPPSDEAPNGTFSTYPPPFPPPPPRIVFVSDRDTNLEIYSMNEGDGSNQTRLTNLPAYDNMPFPSPGGTKVVFVSGRDGNREIYVMSANGTGVTQLTVTDNVVNEWPAWSPDGTRIAFSSDRDGGYGEIYTMNATDGSGLMQLTNNSTGDTFPAWSSTSKVAFSSTRDGGYGEIYVMNADGTNQTRLTNNPAPDNFPAWSPDGSKITFSSNRTGNFEIYVMNVDSTNLTQLTSNSAWDWQPQWGPDGTRIAFTTNRDSNPEIYAMSPDGANQTNLTNNPTGDDWLRGKWVAPSVATSDASNITSSSAILSGNLTDLGSIGRVKVSFQWGLTAGNYTGATPVALTNATDAFSYVLTDLSANTTYHFRARAAGDGLDLGADGIFTTLSGVGIITTVAGTGDWDFYGDDGPATDASLNYPYGVAVDGVGNLYIADSVNYRIRKVDTSGIITTVAGNGDYIFSGDGGPATEAGLNEPRGVAVDGAGNLYIADYANHRVHKVDTAGIITTVAGNGDWAFSGDGGSATEASLYYPNGVAIDGVGNLFIADSDNYRVRKVDTSGIITTVAGDGFRDFSGDGGPATEASLTYPTGVVVDRAGNLYIADQQSNRIRKVDTAGIITTVAGNGSPDFYGDGGPATNASLVWPYGVAVDGDGNLYIADTENNRIRKVDTASGIITTVAGDGSYDFYGDGGPATAAGLNYPRGVAVDGAGNLYIADRENSRIRRVEGIAVPVVFEPTGGSISGHVYQSDNTTPIAGAKIEVFHFGTLLKYSSTLTNIDGYYQLTGLATGRYDVQVNAAGYATESYDNSHTLEGAIPVSVTAPNDTSGIDFSLVPGGTISGYIYQSDNTTPIEGAMVLVFGYGGALYGLTWSGADGSYTTTGLLAGEYALWILATGYAGEWYDNTYNRNEATPVSVTVPNDTPGINFSLDVGGSISGYVYQSDNVTPITGAQLVAVGSAGGPYGLGWSGADGSYTTTGLLTGEYKVQVSALGYITEWYNNVYKQSEATSVPVTAPNDTPGISFSLEIGGTISGHVYQSDNTTPIQRAMIQILYYNSLSDKWVGYGGAYTGADGSYRVGGLPTGQYAVRVVAEGYATEWYDNVYYGSEATPVPVTVPYDTPNINFSLEIGGTISGYVYQSDNITPIANLNVYAVDSETKQWMSSTNTNSSGNYTLSGLPAGSYLVKANAKGSNLNYIDEWYDNVYNQNEATPVSVTAPNDTPNINFSLEIGGTISGHVYQSDNTTPIAGAKIEVFDYDSLSGKWVGYGGTQSAADGSYQTSGLPTGQYGVRVMAAGYATEWYDNVYYREQATPVSVTAPNDTPNINFSLEIGGTISGQVYQSDNTTPIAGAKIEVFDYDSLSGKWVGYGGTQSAADGSYQTSGLPTGQYGVRVMAAGYATEWYDNVYYREQATPVSVTAPNDTPNINFSLEIGGTISGQVTDNATSQPIANLHVYAVDNATREWMAGTNTNSSGNYTLSGLPAGSYLVGTSAKGSNLNYVDKWYDNKYGQHNADPVEVTAPDNTPNINFSLEAIVPRATIEEAVADGIAWLAAQQNPDGSWGTKWPVAKTALAVLKLETHATSNGTSPLDPGYLYRDNVWNGLNYLFANAYTTNITMQPAGNPDTNGNGIGVYFYTSNASAIEKHYVPIYETSLAMMAIAASNSPDIIVPAIPNGAGGTVAGWSYRQVLQDAVDYIAWAQTDSGYGRGGWNYEPMNNKGDRSDQSNSGWVTLGLAYAEAPPPIGFSLPIPGFVRTELNIWIDYIQDDIDGDTNDGGSWYTGPGDTSNKILGSNILRTGNLLQQMAFVGDTLATPRVQAALDYLVRHWNDLNSDPGWRGYHTNYHATYTIMKGLEAFGLDNIDSISWFQNFVDAILSEQAASGSWPSSNFDDGERILSTEWALLTLQKTTAPTREAPDLVISEKHEEWVDEPAGTYKVYFTLKNRGNAIAPGNGYIVKITIDGVPQPSPLINWVLAPGDTWSGTNNVVVTLSGGYDEITVYADAGDNVTELNEANNSLTNTWPAEPDLTIYHKHEKLVDEQQGTYQVYFTVKNIGNVIIPSGHGVGLYVDGNFTEQHTVLQPLAPGETYPGAFSTVLSLTGATDNITVTADVNNEVAEVDETNNSRTNIWSARGDANMDGVVNSQDITKVERIVAGLDAPTPGADANLDGKINAVDITKVERIIAGLN